MLSRDKPRQCTEAIFGDDQNRERFSEKLRLGLEIWAALFLKTVFAVLQESFTELRKLNQDLNRSVTKAKA